jgi:hypothetical protein
VAHFIEFGIWKGQKPGIIYGIGMEWKNILVAMLFAPGTLPLLLPKMGFSAFLVITFFKYRFVEQYLIPRHKC